MPCRGAGFALRLVLDCGVDIVDCYDIGIWNQAALLEVCDVLIAPHTGITHVASCVGCCCHGDPTWVGSED